MKHAVLPLALPPSLVPERLPTNFTTRYHAVHRWFNFVAGFSPEFVAQCIAEEQGRAEVLLDPFMGCGTAQVEAIKFKIRTIGFDPHPIFFRIARAKTSPKFDRLPEIEAAIQRGFRTPVTPSALGQKPAEFLSKLIQPDILSKLVGARIELAKAELDKDDLAFLVLSKILDSASHSKTDGIYKAPTSAKKALDVSVALARTLQMIREDAEELTHRPSIECQLVNSTSEQMTTVRSHSVDLVVTSPPYLNNFDFAEMTRMYLYFWGIATTWGEITERVRAKLIVNTTTALKGHKDKQEFYKNQLPQRIQRRLAPIVEALRRARLVKAGKKEYDFLVYPYFAQMRSVIRECGRVMKPGAAFHMMVSDAALYGTYIPTHEVIAEILEEEGFMPVGWTQVRRRGHRWVLDKREGSSNGLGEYHIKARRPV